MARTGRPRGFDKEEALQQAMRLFWRHGYEATSLSQLKAAMGSISASSFFAAFGSKQGLFEAVLDRYLRTYGQVAAPLQDASLPPRAAVETALRDSARMQTDAAHPLGCLVILSAAVGAPKNHHLQARLAQERQRNRDGLRACVERAITSGELQAATDPAALTALFDTMLLGLAMAAHDGTPLAPLDAAISAAMGAWDACAAWPTRAPADLSGQHAADSPRLS